MFGKFLAFVVFIIYVYCLFCGFKYLIEKIKLIISNRGKKK